MGTTDTISALRRSLGLSQAEFALRLFVTRQAVSRWETGETVPQLDTHRRMAKTFQTSADALLGNPAGLCQSCGMSLEAEGDRGTEKDGSKSREYCAFCFQQGAFTRELTMDEVIELNLQTLDEWNKAAGLQLTRQEAKRQLQEFLPTLRRWKSAPTDG